MHCTEITTEKKLSALTKDEQKALAIKEFEKIVEVFTKEFTPKGNEKEIANFLQNYDLKAEQIKLKKVLDGEIMQAAIKSCQKTVGVIEKIDIDDDKKPVVGKFFTFVEYDSSKMPNKFIMRFDYDHMFEFDLADFVKVSEEIKKTDMTYLDKKPKMQSEAKKLADMLEKMPNNEREEKLISFSKQWENLSGVIKITCPLEVDFKNESKTKENLTADDVKSAQLTIHMRDKFGLVNIEEKRMLTNYDFMADYTENKSEKIIRINQAKNQNPSPPISANCSSFFRKHPVVASVAVGAATAVTFSVVSTLTRMAMG